MSTEANAALQAATRRLDRCYSGSECDWSLFYEPRLEMANFATRYHLVYPALGYFIQLKKQPGLAGAIRPKLDTMYRGLLARRTWSYWHKELSETTWPLQERNLTYAGRLASFIGFYIDAFGEPPAKSIELDGRTITYSALSESLCRQMTESPTCGVIPTVIDQNPCAHLRMPRDMIFHGWSMRLFQAWQHSATMSS